MLTSYNLKMPHAVFGGENAMDNVTTILKSHNVKRVAMFTDKGIEATGLFALPEAAVKASGAAYYVLDDLKPGLDMARACGVPFAAAGWANDIPEIEGFMRENCDLYFKTVPELRAYLFD